MTKKLLILLLLVNTGCASLQTNVSAGRNYCSTILKEQDLNFNKSSSTLNKKAYTDCVAQIATAKAETSVANATWASIITAWATTGIRKALLWV